jgi:hypothetical protein
VRERLTDLTSDVLDLLSGILDCGIDKLVEWDHTTRRSLRASQADHVRNAGGVEMAHQVQRSYPKSQTVPVFVGDDTLTTVTPTLRDRWEHRPVGVDLHVHVRSPALSETDRHRVSELVHRLIVEETTRLFGADEAARGTLFKEMASEELDPRLSLEGLPLKPDDKRLLELLVAKRLREELEEADFFEEAFGTEQSCVCGVHGMGGRVIDLGEVLYKLPESTFANPIYALAYGHEDGIIFTIGPRSLAENESMVTLKVSVASNWDKEIVAFNYCKGDVKRMRVAGGAQNNMTVTNGCGRFHTHNLKFRKAKAFGIWWDMYRINPEPFWHVFGGRQVSIEWLLDIYSFVSIQKDEIIIYGD